MPGGHEGRGGTQVKFSDGMDWWCTMPQPRDDLSTIPFIGEVAGETPAHCYMPETRRRDVGLQIYGKGTPSMNSTLTDRVGLLKKQPSVIKEVATSHGNLHLTSNKRDLGFVPTADAVLFLRHEYLGSRASAPPQRYFPTPWR